MNVSARLIQWRTAAQIIVWRHGWAWLLALLAGGMALALYALALQPARDSLDAMRNELARSSRPATPTAGGPASERQQLLKLQANLVQGSDPAVHVRQLLALARAEGVALTQGEYHEQFHRSTEVKQIQVTQPVRASYAQVKRYIESVLRTMPHVSLDQVVARRDNVGQTELEVRLRWSIWIHAPAAPSSTRNGAKGPL